MDWVSGRGVSFADFIGLRSSPLQQYWAKARRPCGQRRTFNNDSEENSLTEVVDLMDLMWSRMNAFLQVVCCFNLLTSSIFINFSSALIDSPCFSLSVGELTCFQMPNDMLC